MVFSHGILHVDSGVRCAKCEKKRLYGRYHGSSQIAGTKEKTTQGIRWVTDRELSMENLREGQGLIVTY